MEQEVVISKKADAQSCVEELCSKLKYDSSHYNAVIFMAAIRYDFEELSRLIKERFPSSEVIGTTTAGEICSEGFINDSVLLTTMSDISVKTSACLVEYGSRYPVVSKEKIEEALNKCSISCNDPSSHQNAFALAFINGVYNGEESVLTNFYSIIKNDKFMLAGGTAGFTGETAKTFVSANGQVTQDGAAMLFVKTSRPFDIRQEDIFNKSGKTFFVGATDPVNRTIIQLDGKKPLAAYAAKLGVSESEAKDITFENPFGRFLNGSIHIAALAGFTNDGKITTFARIMPNSTLELMHIADPVEKCEKTCKGIKEKISNPKFTLLMSCITRTLHFEKEAISSKIISKYNNTFGTFAGFSAYGEQLGRIHCNQTLVSLVIGE